MARTDQWSDDAHRGFGVEPGDQALTESGRGLGIGIEHQQDPPGCQRCGRVHARAKAWIGIGGNQSDVWKLFRDLGTPCHIGIVVDDDDLVAGEVERSRKRRQAGVELVIRPIIDDQRRQACGSGSRGH